MDFEDDARDRAAKTWKALTTNPGYAFSHGWCFAFALIAQRYAAVGGRAIILLKDSPMQHPDHKGRPFHGVLKLEAGGYLDAFGVHSSLDGIADSLIRKAGYVALERSPADPRVRLPWGLAESDLNARYCHRRNLDAAVELLSLPRRRVVAGVNAAAKHHLSALRFH
jgi:hypothetical protein